MRNFKLLNLTLLATFFSTLGLQGAAFESDGSGLRESYAAPAVDGDDDGDDYEGSAPPVYSDPRAQRAMGALVADPSEGSFKDRMARFAPKQKALSHTDIRSIVAQETATLESEKARLQTQLGRNKEDLRRATEESKALLEAKAVEQEQTQRALAERNEAELREIETRDRVDLEETRRMYSNRTHLRDLQMTADQGRAMVEGSLEDAARRRDQKIEEQRRSLEATLSAQSLVFEGAKRLEDAKLEARIQDQEAKIAAQIVRVEEESAKRVEALSAEARAAVETARTKVMATIHALSVQGRAEGVHTAAQARRALADMSHGHMRGAYTIAASEGVAATRAEKLAAASAQYRESDVVLGKDAMGERVAAFSGASAAPAPSRTAAAPKAMTADAAAVAAEFDAYNVPGELSTEDSLLVAQKLATLKPAYMALSTQKIKRTQMGAKIQEVLRSLTKREDRRPVAEKLATLDQYLRK